MKTKSYAFYLILALFVANIFTLNAQTGAALDFDGTDDYCVLANNSTLNVTQFTIETWVKWTRLASNVDFVCGKGFEQMEIHLNTNNSIRFIPVAGIYLDAPANTLPLNVWTHLACVYNPSTGLAKMYINGAEVVLTHNGSNPLTTPLTDNTQGMTLGIRSPSVYPLQGQLDEFRLWNRALTQAEIQSRMSCEIPTTSSELIVNLHFNQGTAAGSNTGVTSATDASGNSNNFTLTNFTLLGSTSNWVTTGTGVAAISLKGTPTGCGSVNLTASGGTSYAWSSGETTPSATFTTVGTYGVTVTVTNGCTVSALTQTVAVASTPNAVITGTTSDCSSVILTASGGTTYLWNGGSTPNNATNTFTSSGTYTVTVTSSSCPTASATAMATVNITGPTRIYVNAAATGANNGTSWNDAFTSLQSALTTCLQPNGEIWVAKGTYKPSAAPTVCSACSASQNYTFHIKKTMKVYGSFAGTETSLAERTPSVMSANQTILSGDIGTIGVNTDNTFHVVYIVANTVTFDGFKVVDGYALSGAYPIINGNAAYGAFGGGVYVSFSSAVTLSNLILSNNSAMASGSGVDVEFSSNTLIDNCTFSNNSGSALDFFYALGTIISNCKFISNAAPSGGGIKTNAGESLTINNCVFSDNVATAYGGGISVDGGGVLTIKNTVFNNNRADRGGGIYKQQGSSLINLTNCSLVNNQATTSGGGINASSHSSITILNSIFWGNTAPTVPQFSNATVTYSIYPSSFDATNSSSDPLFQNLSDPDGADNIWGTTDDGLQLACNSPARDAATNTGAPTTDMVGNPIFNATKDIGAYEKQDNNGCPIFTSSTACQSTSISNVSGNRLYNFFINNQLVAVLNPNGQNLGTVTVEIASPAATNLYNGVKHLGRNINVNSTIAPTTNYTLCLFYKNTELDAFRTVLGNAVPRSQLNMAWRSGGNLGCDLAAYIGTSSGTITSSSISNVDYGTGNDGFYLQFNLNHFTIFAPTTSSVLPVELLSFEGKNTEGGNLLTWITANERNNAGFDVEASADGILFEKTGFIKGNGKTSAKNDYQFLDKYPLRTTTYYRLQQVDFDGKKTSSNIISIESKKASKGIKVYPNPSDGGTVTIETTPLLGVGGLTEGVIVTNALGQIFFQEKQKGQNELQLDVNTWASGIYFVKSGKEVVKFVKN